MTNWPARTARWTPSSARLQEMRIELLPPNERALEIWQRPAYPADSQPSLPSVHKVRPSSIFDLFVEYLRLPSKGYSSPNARSKSARAFQNASKPCRY